MTAKREVTVVYLTGPQGTLRYIFARPKEAHSFAQQHIGQKVRILRELVLEEKD